MCVSIIHTLLLLKGEQSQGTFLLSHFFLPRRASVWFLSINIPHHTSVTLTSEGDRGVKVTVCVCASYFSALASTLGKSTKANSHQSLFLLTLFYLGVLVCFLSTRLKKPPATCSVYVCTTSTKGPCSKLDKQAPGRWERQLSIKSRKKVLICLHFQSYSPSLTILSLIKQLEGTHYRHFILMWWEN